MKKIILLFALLVSVGMLHAQQRLIDLVNPIVGTNGMGHTFPGACYPFGLVQLSPDTDTIPQSIDGRYVGKVYEYCAGYQYSDKTIVGFSHTHFNGTGHSDLGDFLIMPTTGKLRLNPGTADNPDSGYRSRFNHDTEKSSPGYYSVMLDDYNVKAELTATKRAGVHKYTFPQGEGHIILDMTHGIYNYDGKVLWANIRVENDTLVTGYRITRGWARTNYTYFAMTFSKPIKNYGHRNAEKVMYNGFWRRFKLEDNFPEIGGTKITAFFDFDFAQGEELVVKMALSPVSTLGAMENLKAEASGKTFAQIRTAAENGWEKELSAFDVKGDYDSRCCFYTSVYHTMINPSTYMDVDGQYRGLDHNIHKAEGFTNYTVFSLWDTYRALHPLFNVIKRDVSKDIVSTMLAHYQQSVHGALPIWSHMGNENWCMIGYHAVSVLSDADAKGIPMDKELALKAMLSSSTMKYYDGLGEYMKLGYVPLEKQGSAASVTLEFAYDDWTIADFARRMGKTAVAQEYTKRALNYENLFDPKLGFVRPKHADGRWKENFDLLDTHGQGFIEGNSWNYSFYVPQDVNGLIKHMGGDKRFIQRLDSLFSMELPAKYYENTEDITKEGLMGNYVHGNEPSQHIPYLYAWTSEPWHGQKWIRQIMDTKYLNKIDGLCGNDDCGQMSAWYIFSSMGFYPVCPGSDQYVLGAPYFPEINMKLENGKTFTVKANKIDKKNLYVKSVTLNGKPYTKAYITHADIMNGGELVFEMAAKPNKARKFKTDEMPYSLSNR